MQLHNKTPIPHQLDTNNARSCLQHTTVIARPSLLRPNAPRHMPHHTGLHQPPWGSSQPHKSPQPMALMPPVDPLCHPQSVGNANVHDPMPIATLYSVTLDTTTPAPNSCPAHKHTRAVRAVSAPWLQSRWCTPCRCWLPPAVLLPGHRPGPEGSHPPCWHPVHTHTQTDGQADRSTLVKTGSQSAQVQDG